MKHYLKKCYTCKCHLQVFNLEMTIDSCGSVHTQKQGSNKSHRVPCIFYLYPIIFYLTSMQSTFFGSVTLSLIYGTRNISWANRCLSHLVLFHFLRTQIPKSNLKSLGQDNPTSIMSHKASAEQKLKHPTNKIIWGKKHFYNNKKLIYFLFLK